RPDAADGEHHGPGGMQVLGDEGTREMAGAYSQALVAELFDREGIGDHDRGQKGPACGDGLLGDFDGGRAAPTYHLGVGPEGAKHHVFIGAKRPVGDESQAASTSFTSRTALLASSA